MSETVRATRCHSGGSTHEEVWTGLQWLPRYARTCTVRSDASWVMVAWDLPPTHPHQTEWQTDTCENITFPQLHWWAVNMKMPNARIYINFVNASKTATLVLIRIWMITSFMLMSPSHKLQKKNFTSRTLSSADWMFFHDFVNTKYIQKCL